MTIANLVNMMTKPRWCLGMAHATRRTFGNIVGHVKGVDDMASLSAWTNKQFDPSLNWSDVDWIKERWGGKLILKGIQDVEDAEMAAKSGADALIVSNHGGRQLDGALFDRRAARCRRSGRESHRGSDGRRHSLGSGRAQGAGARRQGRLDRPRLPLRPRRGGEAGVTKALDIIRKELDVTMSMCGVTDVRRIDGSVLAPSR